MKICDMCGALYLMRFERTSIFETRTVVLEANRCHCMTAYESLQHEPGNKLRELTDVERTHLHDFITRYP